MKTALGVTAKRSAIPRRVATLLAAVLVSAAPVAAVTVTAHASPNPPKSPHTKSIDYSGTVPRGFGSWQELMAVQKKLVTAADRVSAAATRTSGYAGITLAPEQRELHLYWKGTLPATVRALAAKTDPSVTVKTLPAAYSARELATATAKLTSRPGGAITSVAAKPDGSGLTVTATNATAARSATRNVGVPVTVNQGVRPSVAYSRWADTPPFWGGGAWRNVTRSTGCSTGFAVWHNGATEMLTAGHCGGVGDTAYTGGNLLMGSISDSNSGLDVALINASSAGRVYNNQIGNTANEFSNPVIGTFGSYAGLWVCTSGAYSGTDCGIQVQATGVNIWVGWWIYNTVQAEQTSHTNAAGQGDSGGPVEVVNASNTTQVYAAGTITAGDTSTAVPCTGYVTSGRTCTWRMFYAPWDNAVNAFGVSIVTG